MNKLLLDTSVLIDHLRCYGPAIAFLEMVFKGGVPVAVSVVTEMELYAGKSMQDAAKEEAVRKLLGLFEVLPVTSPIARRAGALLRQYRPQGLTPTDAIIAATVLEEGATLVTRNIRDFRAVEGLLIFDLPDLSTNKGVRRSIIKDLTQRIR